MAPGGNEREFAAVVHAEHGVVGDDDGTAPEAGKPAASIKARVHHERPPSFASTTRRISSRAHP
jgi:hypothetical protein